MRVHRAWVLGGYRSLITADAHIQWRAAAGVPVAGRAAPKTSLRAAIGAPDAIPRPPGVGADHYLVKDGVLA